MGRLIDADELIKRFEGLRDEHETYSISYNALYEILVGFPTAYDIEKVVAELRKREYNSRFDGECAPEAYMEAIDIVREGGAT